MDTSLLPIATYRLRNDEMENVWCFLKENNHCMPHFHLCVEIAYVLDGEMIAVVDGSEMTIHREEMAVISSYAIHHFYTPSFSRAVIAVIPMPFVPVISARLQQMEFCRCLIEDPAPLAVSLINTLYAYREAASADTQHGLSLALLGTLIDSVGIRPIQPNPSSEVMRRVIAHMQAHFTEPLTIGMLAQYFRYSRSRLSHLFQTTLKTSFTSYLNSLRCRFAVVLLKETTLSVAQIAGEVGFNNLRTFYHAFHARYHMPPLAYAKQLTKAHGS